MANERGITQKDKCKQRTAVEIGCEVITAMDTEFHDASDRVIAIVGAAYLDSLLEQLLLAIFVSDIEEVRKLLSPDRPLGSTVPRYQLAYCLGLIEKQELEDLKTIAKIRNKFAHNYQIKSFNDGRVKDLLAQLHYGRQLDSIELLRNIEASGRRQFQDTVRDLFATLVRKLNCSCRVDTSKWFVADPPK
jgi:DNA-binding MltR family transcriptional regulator